MAVVIMMEAKDQESPVTRGLGSTNGSHMAVLSWIAVFRVKPKVIVKLLYIILSHMLNLHNVSNMHITLFMQHTATAFP